MDGNQPADSQKTVTRKNTVLAGIAYLVCFLGWIGLAINAITYYKTKDKYAKFHSGQAIFLVLVIFTISILSSFAISGMISVNPLDYSNPFQAMTAMYSYLYVMNILVSLLYIILAIAAFLGKEFRIPIAAQLLEK